MSDKKQVSIIIPVYNEEKTIKNLIKDIKASLKNTIYEIIAVDDGSTDKSKKILKNIKKIKILTHPSNKGYGAAIKTGIKNAKYNSILIIDADGTYPADAIPPLLNYVGQYDMVVGSRTGKSVKIPFFRMPAKWFLNKLANYLSNTKIPDLNSGLRVFKKKIAERFMSLFPDGFSFTVTITLACLTNGYSVKYMPINYYRRKKRSSMHPIKEFIRFNNLIIRIITYFKPLNIFLPISIFFILIGIIKTIIDLLITGRFGLGGITSIIAGIQIGFLGLIAELIIKRTKL
jgi:glycosyltransferase involved in cell wall biosynthesis